MSKRDLTGTGRLLLLALALLLAASAVTGCFSRSVDEQRARGTTGLVAPQSEPSQDYGAAMPPVASDSAKGTVPLPEGSGEDASTVPAEDRLIITNKNMRIEVEDVNATVEAIRALAAKNKANVTNLQVSTETDVPVYNYGAASTDSAYDNAPLAGWVTVRVPADKYEAFIAEAAKLGKVLRQSEDTQDVTQEHVDLKARLGNLQAEEKRLREFFGTAKTVNDMLAIERELSRVRGEIEAMDAQMKYLERQAAMATVTFELVEPKPIVRPEGESWGVAEALTESVRWFVGTLNGLIVLLGPALAIGIFVVLPVFLVVRWLIRRDRKRREAAAEAAVGEDERS